jgi:hypothetical protein
VFEPKYSKRSQRTKVWFLDTPTAESTLDSWFIQSTYHKIVSYLMPEMVLSPSFHPISEICLGMPYPTVLNLKLWFSGTWCMNILPDDAFLVRTLYAQFSRCVSPSTTGCFTWLNTLTTVLFSHIQTILSSHGAVNYASLHPTFKKVGFARIFYRTHLRS